MKRKLFKISDTIQIINNDCLKELKTFEKEIADVFVTSPPYNIGMNYNQYEDNKSHDEYLNWLKNIAIEIKRVMKPEGSFFINIGNTNTMPNIAEQVCEHFLKDGLFFLQNHIIWVKSISVIDQSYGHFKPINSHRYLNNCWEKIFHFTKTGSVHLDRLAVGVPYTHKSNINRWKHNIKGKKVDLRCAGNCWFMPYKTVTKHKDHPAGYPIELPLRCIKLHGIKHDMLVIDPFLGAGTTLQACKLLEIRGYGIELDEDYCNIAVEKLL